jgi:hypothetical protein
MTWIPALPGEFSTCAGMTVGCPTACCGFRVMVPHHLWWDHLLWAVRLWRILICLSPCVVDVPAHLIYAGCHAQTCLGMRTQHPQNEFGGATRVHKSGCRNHGGFDLHLEDRR